ncbi:MAG TPA: CopD family protein, partial [Cyclobacteriaceae bacterium]|nr:CopD family protein [Cyclobacteriaceae bacterium]
REAHDKPETERKILQHQFQIMIRRLWFGITWPSCILTILFGTWLVILYGSFPTWLMLKIIFVIGLLLYHISLHLIYKKQLSNIFNYTSKQLRLWNEVATLFLCAIVFLVVLKSALSFLWGVVFLFALFILLKTGIIVYQFFRKE